MVEYAPDAVERGLRDLILYEWNVQPVRLELVVKGAGFEVRLTLPYLSTRKNKDAARHLKLFLPPGYTLNLTFEDPK